MTWMPRPGIDSIDDVVWLPRMIDKARRVEQLGNGTRLVDGYCYGDNDFIDSKVLRFLRTDDRTVSEIVRTHPEDDEAARIIIERSGRTPDECREFSRSITRTFQNFALMAADEGTLPPGFKTSALRFFYNRLMMPIAYSAFRRAEQKRRSTKRE